MRDHEPPNTGENSVLSASVSRCAAIGPQAAPFLHPINSTNRGRRWQVDPGTLEERSRQHFPPFVAASSELVPLGLPIASPKSHNTPETSFKELRLFFRHNFEWKGRQRVRHVRPSDPSHPLAPVKGSENSLPERGTRRTHSCFVDSRRRALATVQYLP